MSDLQSLLILDFIRLLSKERQEIPNTSETQEERINLLTLQLYLEDKLVGEDR